MLGIIGFITIITIVGLLLTEKTSPITALIIIPIVGALVAGSSVHDIGLYFNEGAQKVFPIVIMFIFAIIYFGIMNDVGLFTPMINKMIALSHGSIQSVVIGTVFIAAIAHLDGSGASTFLITIPALLPLYRRLRMSPYLLLLLVGASASIMNMLPWAGPIGRASALLSMNPTDLWRPLVPLQIIALFMLVPMAILLGIREKRRIANLPALTQPLSQTVFNDHIDIQTTLACAKPQKLAINLLLTLSVIGVLVWGIIPSGFVFMIGVSLALSINYPKVADQMDRIKAHAPSAVLMGCIILAAGAFLGILTGTKMLQALAVDIVAILPTAMLPYLHIIIGILGAPFELILNTDAYYFALVPIVEQITSSVGISPQSSIYAMIIGNILGTFISPFSPALWLGLGLADLKMGKHIRYSFFWIWGLSVLLLIIAILLGIV
ncbi:CitMHS family transporter [Shewanella surugensis]|uniref:Citrate:proton symporter n=1 Tax=Shewanella surugensis TaxID=212020 RepID=A0ABT0L700_9GAMM|nr:citrate:proton symporter [Shewanella surugensis]MCL1123440.1 citrate:proton symporter [Shewanella surugensis]